MGVLAHFYRRKDRDRIRLRPHQYPAKHRIAPRTKQTLSTSSSYRTSPSSTLKEKSPFPSLPFSTNKNDKNLVNKESDLILINAATATIVQNEVMDLLNSSLDRCCTTLEIANALKLSQSCMESHSALNEKNQGFFASSFLQKLNQNGKIRVGLAENFETKPSREQPLRRLNLKLLSRSRKMEKESMRSRYEWVNALNVLEKCPSSRNTIISTWEEAKKSLEKVFIFPRSSHLSEESYCDKELSSLKSKAIDIERSEKLDSEIELVQENVNNLSVSNVKWKQIASYPDQHLLYNELKGKDDSKIDREIETLIEKESIEKADLYFNARIRTAEDLANRLRDSDTRKELEERMIANEARKRASQLMRTLTDEEQNIVESAIYGSGNGDEVIAQSGTDSVQRASMKTLKPGTWLNDEIIHYFYLMLSKRDEELCGNDPSRKRSHFFKSFFMTKLLNEGNVSCDGKYEYRNVKRWSKKVPGKDIFNLDKILFPINMGGMHWICAAIFMTKKRIEIFDSMGSNGNRYLDALFKYIQDEHLDKKKSPLSDLDSWQLVPTQPTTPRQTNGKLFQYLTTMWPCCHEFLLNIILFSHSCYLNVACY